MSTKEFNDEATDRYFAFIREFHITGTEDTRVSFSRGFYLGAQYAMRTSSSLSPHIARFIEFMMWLTERETPTDEHSNSNDPMSEV
jgi:hypothetical protein